MPEKEKKPREELQVIRDTIVKSLVNTRKFRKDGAERFVDRFLELSFSLTAESLQNGLMALYAEIEAKDPTNTEGVAIKFLPYRENVEFTVSILRYTGENIRSRGKTLKQSLTQIDETYETNTVG